MALQILRRLEPSPPRLSVGWSEVPTRQPFGIGAGLHTSHGKAKLPELRTQLQLMGKHLLGSLLELFIGYRLASRARLWSARKDRGNAGVVHEKPAPSTAAQDPCLPAGAAQPGTHLRVLDVRGRGHAQSAPKRVHPNSSLAHHSAKLLLRWCRNQAPDVASEPRLVAARGHNHLSVKPSRLDLGDLRQPS